MKKRALPNIAASVFSSLVLILSLPSLAAESDQVGKLVAVQGDVRVFKNPSRTLPKNVDQLPPLPSGVSRVLFEREYYEASAAKPGMELLYGNIIRTAPGARAILIFPNGDHYTVGPSTAYRAFWKRGNTPANISAKPEVALMYGRIRGVVSPTGPRNNLTIRTRTATMGVRGTDFFIGEDFETGKIEVAVQRGKVAVTPIKPQSTQAPAPGSLSPKVELAKPIEVKSGEVAAVSAKPNAQPIAVAKTDKQLLTEIQGLTRVDTKAQAKMVATLAPEVAQELETLQKKAVEATIQDVKRATPETAQAFESATKEGKTLTLQDLNTTVIQQAAKVAPVGAPRKLPEDLMGIDASAAYEKYFNAE